MENTPLWYIAHRLLQPQNIILILKSSILLSFSAFADNVTSEVENRIAIIERKLELQQEEADAAKKINATLGAGADGFRIANSTNDINIRIGSLLQTDARIFLNDTFD